MDQPAHTRRQTTEHSRTYKGRKGERKQYARATAEGTSADARFVSVKTLAGQWDCSRSTVSRLLKKAGVQAYYFGRGRNGSKRYLRRDVEAFLDSVERTT